MRRVPWPVWGYQATTSAPAPPMFESGFGGPASNSLFFAGWVKKTSDFWQKKDTIEMVHHGTIDSGLLVLRGRTIDVVTNLMCADDFRVVVDLLKLVEYVNNREGGERPERLTNSTRVGLVFVDERARISWIYLMSKH